MPTYLQLLGNYKRPQQRMQKQADYNSDLGILWGLLDADTQRRIKQDASRYKWDGIGDSILLAYALQAPPESNMKFKRELLRVGRYLAGLDTTPTPETEALLKLPSVQKGLNLDSLKASLVDKIKPYENYMPFLQKADRILGGRVAYYGSKVDPRAAALNPDAAPDAAVAEVFRTEVMPKVFDGKLPWKSKVTHRVSKPAAQPAHELSYVAPALLAGAPLALLGGALGGHRVGFGTLAAAGLAGLGYGMYREHTGKGFEPIDNWVNGLRSELKLAPLEAPKAPATAVSGSPAR